MHQMNCGDRTGHRVLLSSSAASDRPNASTATWTLPSTLPLGEYSAVKLVWTSCVATTTLDSIAVVTPQLRQDSYDTATKSMGRTLGVMQPKLMSGSSYVYYADDSDNGPLDVQAGSFETYLTVALQHATAKANAVPAGGEWSVMLEFID